MKKLLVLLFIFWSCNSSILADPAIIIQFNLSQRSQVKLTVENSYDTIISTLLDQELSAGTHRVEFNTVNLAEGVYFYTIEIIGIEKSNYSRSTKNFLLVK